MRLKSFNRLNAFSMRQQPVETLAEAEGLFPVAAIWNDRLGSALIQFLAQFGAVVCLVAKHPFRRLYSADQALRDRAIMRFASSQQDGEKAPFSICECVYLRVAPSARAANSLLLLPPFPARCRAMRFHVRGVRSSVCLWIVRFQQAPGTGFPRRHAAPSAQSDYRSLSEVHTRAGNRTSDSRFSEHARCR